VKQPEKVVSYAREHYGDSNIDFFVGSIYDIPKKEKYDLVVCSEVLEHLEKPEDALEQLKKVGKKYVICSVPREPIWRILNMARGKYWKDLGNTPGHINHWSQRSFIKFLKKNGCKVLDVKSPLPWTVVLIEI
jgi:2-polyprenyl-3-methyl-5-hydroxy-6-metoxy-1,4-benzoquinol methylase